MYDVRFNEQPELFGPKLNLRPLQATDLEALYSAASDPTTWAGHPVKDRYKRDVFEPYFAFLLESGGTLAIVAEAGSTIIGCSKYYSAPGQTDSISIGFTFLNPAYWGGTANREVKRLMLDHAYAFYDEVWFHIAPDNIRSQKATAKLGAKHVHDATINLSGTPSLWRCYRLARQDWLATRDEVFGS